jgi:N-acetylglucosamine-6-phosphate deacetylase
MNNSLCLYNATIFTGVATIQQGALIIEGEQLSDIVSEERLKRKSLPENCQFIDLKGALVAPGYIDTHVHGCFGYDTANGSYEDFLGISAGLVRFGVTSFCPTLYPLPESKMLQAIHNGAKAKGHEQGARINGLHLEGPFISCNQLGVQRPETIRAVDVDFMRQMYLASAGTISIMTVAPELKNMRDLALYCVRKNIVLSAGHSDASYENMIEGVQAGILHCTHLFNAMRKMHHRDPGLVGAILIHEDLSCEIVADGVHVHPALIKMVMRDKGAGKIILVTDGLAPTGLSADSGPIFANGEEVYLSEEGIFKRKKDDVIAGSSLTMERAVRNVVSWGASNEMALRMASVNPANLLHIDKQTGYLLPGRLADFVVLDKATLKLQHTYVGGSLKYSD